ncbi:MAG TPA: GAF domain-containing protein [Anaerolineales bacterium]|nr:GAF domain-containing protein [Anaerolineales bacterium]
MTKLFVSDSIQPFHDEREKLAMAGLLRAFLLIEIAGILGIALADFTAGQPRTLYASLPLLIVLIASVWLLRRGVLFPAQFLIPLGLLLIRDYVVLDGVGIHDVSMLVFAAAIILAYLTLTKPLALVFTGLTILSTSLITLASMYGMVQGDTFAQLTNLEDLVEVAILLAGVSAVMFLMVDRLNQSIQQAWQNGQRQIEANRELRDLQASLENKVSERTAALERANQINRRRAGEFEALTLVGAAINSIRHMSELLPQIAAVISERFGYYHVGIFLNDEDGRVAILSASNSEGGRRMLERGHRLKIGEQGIVGNVAATGKVRIARNVGEDTAYFNNPDLPETLSEMALPLRSGSKIVGVMDIQSTQVDAFSQEDVEILSLLADQVSLAIDNTKLLETTNKSLAEAEALYRQYLRQAWNRLPREERLLGYRSTASGSSPLDSPIDLDANLKGGNRNQETSGRLITPIKLRGEVIGNLVIQAPQKDWNPDQLDLVQAVADRVALSAENARLFDETSRRAERERMVSEITSKIRSTNNPEEMINIALNELRGALGATQVELIPQAVSAPKGDPTTKSSAVPQKSDKAHNGNGANK